MAIISALWGWLAGAVGSLLSDGLVRWLAFKVIITALFVTILPVILNNAFYYLLDAIFSSAGTQLQGAAGAISGGQSVVIQLTGMVAWAAVHCSLVSAVSVWISIIAIKYTLGLVPFVRL